MMRPKMSAKLVAEAAFVSAILLISLSACGQQAAPGEGVDHPPMEKPMPEIVSAEEAVQSPDLTKIDLGTMEESEIGEIVPPGYRCSFAYSAESPPVLAGAVGDSGTARGIAKIHGRLIQVSAEAAAPEDLADGVTYSANGLTLEVKPDLDEENETRNGMQRRQADLIFELQQGLHVGYRGWYDCGSKP